MGWLWIPKPENIKEYFREDFEFENDNVKQTILDSAIVHFNEYYAAVKRVNKKTGEVQVYAAVCALAYDRHNYYDFGYKDMDESVGPVQTECPERILKMLTPTDHVYANNWRHACWSRINRRKAKRNA